MLKLPYPILINIYSGFVRLFCGLTRGYALFEWIPARCATIPPFFSLSHRAYTSIVKISLLSSFYHIVGKEPGNLNVSFYCTSRFDHSRIGRFQEDVIRSALGHRQAGLRLRRNMLWEKGFKCPSLHLGNWLFLYLGGQYRVRGQKRDMCDNDQ